ncbi:hypothetical protein [Rahnella sp. NRRL B-41462]|uniref:hypothetical protein n=1 Tax=Rahnella sp. NRRL B-41462 TaxID=1610579 RepID=UPI000DD41A41|nr:hypothetical protein [Rahnella sp. NRRL B-41462]
MMNDETYTYAVIDISTNIVINRIDWDGVQEWAPPDGCIAVRVDDPAAGGIGDSYNPKTGGFTKAEV